MMMYEIVLCAFSQWSRFKNKNAITLHYVQCAFRSDQIDWRAIQEIFFVFFFSASILVNTVFLCFRSCRMNEPPVCVYSVSAHIPNLHMEKIQITVFSISLR